MILTQSLVGITSRKDGKPQVSYAGHPLYLYVGDQKPATRPARGSRRSAPAGSR